MEECNSVFNEKKRCRKDENLDFPLAKRICDLHINAQNNLYNGVNMQENQYQPVLNEMQNPYYYGSNKGSNPGGYPQQGGAAAYPGAGGVPHQGAASAPYPGAGANPYPGAGGASAPYPGAGGAPYPGAGGAPYPGAGGAPYPGAGGANPYPGAGGYPQQPGAPFGSQAPYPTPGQMPMPMNQGPGYSMTPPNPGFGYPAQAPSTGYQGAPGYPPQSGMPQMGYAPNFPHQAYQTAQAPVNMTQGYQQYQNVAHSVRKGTPTLIPVPNFDASRDCQILRKAMKGFGTDEAALINVICRRTNIQRQEIVRAFKQSFGKELKDDIKSETRGNFEDILVALLTPLTEFYCKELRTAMVGVGTDELCLIEILCCMSNREIHEIKNFYYKKYGTTLEQDLKSETSGHFKRLLVSLCNANRDESGIVNPQTARMDAQELVNAGVARLGTDESTFNRILCQRNFEQLKLVCAEYQKLTNHTLIQAVKREFSGDIQDGLIAILECVKDTAEFFAKRLHNSMAGLGTNDRQLIRIVATRCEIDMVEIKASFERTYGKTLKSFVKGDTSGDYRNAILTLIGEER